MEPKSLSSIQVHAFHRIKRGIGYCPVPVRVTVFGLPDALSVIVTVPLWEPVEVGLNVTLIVQLAPPATEVPQVLVCAYCDEVVIRVMLSATVPALVKVTF